MVGGFTVLKEICPDRATPELMELTARLGSMLPYRQAASVLAEFLPIEPTETHATVRKRTPALQLPTVFYAATGRQPPHYGWRHLYKINHRCLWLIEAARLWEPFLFLSGSS
jgi:hypothetical protein